MGDKVFDGQIRPSTSWKLHELTMEWLKGNVDPKGLTQEAYFAMYQTSYEKMDTVFSAGVKDSSTELLESFIDANN